VAKRLFIAATLATFLCLTGIDFIVHSVLYYYGLRFDVEWADPYWTVLTLSFLSIAVLAALTYMMNENGEKRTALLIFLTIFGLYQAGLLDILWIVLWATFSFQDPYILTNVWWWSPYYRYLSIPWRVQHQILLLIIATSLLSLAWVKLAKPVRH